MGTGSSRAPHLSHATGGLLGTASLYFISRTGGFCIGCAPKVSLLSLRRKYDCGVAEESSETVLSELSGCGMLRRQQELHFSAAARVGSGEDLLCRSPCPGSALL